MIAVVVVDVQADFVEGGALAARDTLSVIPVINALVDAASAAHRVTVFTRDWHPSDHGSFRANGGIWPPHCVQDTPGAAFARGLRVPADALIVSKGVQRHLAGYSAFEGTPLQAELRDRAIRSIAVCGIATEYCVQNTALDAMRLGLEVTLITDAIRPVELQPGDSSRAIARMEMSGARKAVSRDIINGTSIPR